MSLHLIKSLYTVRATDEGAAELLEASVNDPFTGKKQVRFDIEEEYNP